MADTADYDWNLLNHYLAWAKGCIRMVTYVAGSSRYILELKATDPVDGAYIQVRGVGPNLLSAVNDMMFQMQQYLADPTFQRMLQRP